MMVFNEIYSEKIKVDILLAPECKFGSLSTFYVNMIVSDVG